MLQLSRKKLYLSSLSQIETRFEKKQKSIDVVSIVSIKKKDFIYYMFVIFTLIMKKKIDAFRNHDKLRCYQTFYFSIKNKKIRHQ